MSLVSSLASACSGQHLEVFASKWMLMKEPCRLKIAAVIAPRGQAGAIFEGLRRFVGNKQPSGREDRQRTSKRKKKGGSETALQRPAAAGYSTCTFP